MTRRALAVGVPLVAAVAAGAVLVATASSSTLRDEETLRQRHADVLRAHRESNVDLLLVDAVEDFVLANRGEIGRPTLEERRARFNSYLGRTRFDEYRDLTEPVVRVSKDGTLGWVIAQVRAKGVQKSDAGAAEPIAFQSAWIELYEKRAGRWVAIGNVSNFKP